MAGSFAAVSGSVKLTYGLHRSIMPGSHLGMLRTTRSASRSHSGDNETTTSGRTTFPFLSITHLIKVTPRIFSWLGFARITGVSADESRQAVVPSRERGHPMGYDADGVFLGFFKVESRKILYSNNNIGSVAFVVFIRADNGFFLRSRRIPARGRPAVSVCGFRRRSGSCTARVSAVSAGREQSQCDESRQDSVDNCGA